MTPIFKTTVWHEVKDYLLISLGIIIYVFSWDFFLYAYQIPTGATTGIAAVVNFATGIPTQYTYFAINIILLLIALKVLGFKFCLKTIYAVFFITFCLSILNWAVDTYSEGAFPKILGEGQDFMACVVGSCLCGVGIAIAFLNNGSMGGTDIICAIATKYRDITFGRTMMYLDICIVTSSYFVLETWRNVLFGYCTLIITSLMLDYVVNSTRRSVQFFIFSKKYEEIGAAITHDLHRGVTILDGTGFYTRAPQKVLVVMAKQYESTIIFRLIKHIDPDAFVSQSNVIGVYGNGFDRIKAK